MSGFQSVAWVAVSILTGCSLTEAWRSECDIDGLDVQVGLHGLDGSAFDPAAGRSCRATFMNYTDVLEFGAQLDQFDVIFTDSLALVPFAGRRGLLHFLEDIPPFPVLDNLDDIMQQKTQLLSVLLPSSDVWTELTKTIHEQAQAMMPEHIYFDDGSLESQSAAFTRYRFCLIADDMEKRSISPAFIRSLGFHTIALYNGFVEIGAMVFNGIADFDPDPFDLRATVAMVNKHNGQLGSLWHYQRILQDQLRYRYNRPFEERLYSQACTVCRLKANVHRNPNLVFVGIYSAGRNFDKRQAVRETWGRIIRDVYGLHYKFFLGEAPSTASADALRLRAEAEEHDDLVFLGVSDGYRLNSRKGLLFLEWIAAHYEAEFLLKTDDDVYFRPGPLLEQLRSRPAAQYAWGFFDYISPVPREEGHNFHNTLEVFPFDVFPPYPRGVVRVLSMDVVRLLAKASHENRLRLIYGDDPCIGVHLRQLLVDPVEPLPSLTLDDFDNRVFAMEPSCHAKLWSRMSNRTWIVHHVSADQVTCMWNKDLEMGLYMPGLGGSIDLGNPPATATSAALPDLCSCADSSLDDRTDLDDLQSETMRILEDDNPVLEAGLETG